MGKVKENLIESEESKDLIKRASSGDKTAFMELMEDFFDRTLAHEDASFCISGTNTDEEGITTMGAIGEVDRAMIAVHHIEALKQEKLRVNVAGHIMTEVLTTNEREQILPTLVVGSLANQLDIDLTKMDNPDMLMQRIADRVSKSTNIPQAMKDKLTGDIDISELADDEFYS